MNATTTDPIVAEARQLALVKPPDVLDILSKALYALEDTNRYAWLYLKVDTDKNPETLSFSSLQSRMYRSIIRLHPQLDDFILPLELISKCGPSEWALLYFDGDQVTLIFHDLGPAPTRETIKELLQRSKYFEEVRGIISPERLVPPNRAETMGWIEKNRSERPTVDVYLAQQIVERYFSQIAA